VSDKIKGAVIGGLLLLLACSLLGNMLLFTSWQTDQQRAVKAEANLVSANSMTEVCNTSIKALEDFNFKRGVLAGEARERAKKKANELEWRAQQELTTPATVPGDACKSAQDRVDRIMRARAAGAGS
jgi:hypothetical protein